MDGVFLEIECVFHSQGRTSTSKVLVTPSIESPCREIDENFDLGYTDAQIGSSEAALAAVFGVVKSERPDMSIFNGLSYHSKTETVGPARKRPKCRKRRKRSKWCPPVEKLVCSYCTLVFSTLPALLKHKDQCVLLF